MTREEMMDKVISRYGFEAAETIWFCRLAEDETVSLEALSRAMVSLESCSFQAPRDACGRTASVFHYIRCLVVCQEKSCTKNKNFHIPKLCNIPS